MLAASLERLESTVPDDALVLDVGGWIKPLARADWVLDIMPFDGRGQHGLDGTGPERFSAETWVQRDICDRAPWPFEDDRFDFAVCSHTLEDVRDPIWVCSELARVAKAGYIEVPSRIDEQTYYRQGPWVGWGHHHWLVDVGDGRIDFVFKHHVIHGPEANRFPPRFHESFDEADLVQTLWWEGGFEYGERVLLTGEEVDAYLGEFVKRHLPAERRAAAGPLTRLTRRLRS
jgi:Methyltransferase domain